MFRRHKIVCWLLFLALLAGFCLFGGCSPAEQEDPALQQDPEETGQSEQIGETERVFTDAVGREVTIPAEVNKVYSTSPIGTMLVYTINPDKLAGWNAELRAGELRFIAEEYHRLPVIGGWFGKTAEGNVEEIMKENPDVIISVGDIDSSSAETADQIQEQTNIPVALLNLDLDKIDQTYIALGELMNEKEVAGDLALYCRETVADILDKAAQISAGQRIKVYYAEGPQGLNTDPAGSRHVQVLDMVGGLNVAEIEMPGKAGQADVSLEQVLHWDPDLIICWHHEQDGYYEGILSDPDWQGISAVKNNKVYEIPCAPFSWFDRPPSVNRVLGLKWLGNLLYPGIYDYDLMQETKEFYDLFYHYELSDEEAAELLKNALPH